MSNGKILNGALSAYTISSNVLNVLRNPSILQIGFELNGLGVTGTRYSVVADAIYEGKISCEVVHQFKLQPGETLEPGTSIAASYHPPGNTMYFPSESFGEVNAGEQAAILHEATHAIFDLYAPTNEYRVLKIDDETAAVLAQAFYFRLCVRSGVGAETDFKSTRHGDLALQIADRIIAERGGFDRGKGTFFLRDKRMYFLRPQQTASLRDAVARHWELIKKHDAAGRPTDSSGTLSIYDGVVNCISCLGHQK